MKRAGLCLQKILQKEYGDAYEGDLTKKDPKAIMKERNPRLAHLTPSQALAALKMELKAYATGDDPFDREFRVGETVRAWWVAVQKKQFGQVLGVYILFLAFATLNLLTLKIQALAIKLYSIAVVSMEDERTMSVITWLNSAKRSSQDVSTVQDHVQIRDWHRYNPAVRSNVYYYVLV